MKIETKMKLEKYLPFIRCCNDGNLKINIAQIVQTIILAAVVGAGSSVISTKMAVTEVNSELKYMRNCIEEIKAFQRTAIEQNGKNYESMIANRQDIIQLRERINYMDKRMDLKGIR